MKTKKFQMDADSSTGLNEDSEIKECNSLSDSNINNTSTEIDSTSNVEKINIAEVSEENKNGEIEDSLVKQEPQQSDELLIQKFEELPNEDFGNILSPVFHLPPPLSEDEEEFESAIDESLLQNSDGIPVTTKIEDELTQGDKNGDIVFCRCCGCFGLTCEFYEQVYCTRACSDSYDLHMSRGPDGKFKKPATPVTGLLNKKPKLSVSEDTNHGHSMNSSSSNTYEPISMDTTEEVDLDKVYSNTVSIKKAAVVRKSESKSCVDGTGKLKANKTSNGVISSTNNKKNMKRKSIDVPPKELPVKIVQSKGTALTKLPDIQLKVITSTKSDDTQLNKSGGTSPDMHLKLLGGGPLRMQRTKSLELPSGTKVFTGTKSTAFYSKDRKRNFPQVLSRRMPSKVSPERKTDCSGSDSSEQNESSGRISSNGDFDWQKYLAESKAKSAPHRLFRQPAMPPPNPFRVGMMLESIDPQHQSLICVAAVVEIQGYRVRLRFQGFSEAYDYWVNADSLDIFPPGWCEENNLELEPPPGAANPFNWHTYIVENQVEVAPRHIFAVSKEDFSVDSGVKIGMKLEAVDIRNQNLVCVATVGKVMGDRILVHFDSWDPLYDYWTDLTSPFIRPVGWCEKNNVKLTPPNYCKPDFSWEKYLRETSTQAMPARLFRPLPPVGFRKGFKIECVDKRNPFLIRVATIAEVEEHQLHIHFDNWPQMFDYKVYELSPDIHPVGWCAHTAHPLQPPPPADGNWSGPCAVFGCLGLGHMRGPKFLTHNSDKYCPYALHNYKKDWILADRLILLERSMGHSHNDASSSLEPSQKIRGENKDASKVDKEVVVQQSSTSTVTRNGTIKVSTIKRKRISTNPGPPIKRRKGAGKQANNPNSVKVEECDEKKNDETNVDQSPAIVKTFETKMESDPPEINMKLKVDKKEKTQIDQVKSSKQLINDQLITQIKSEPCESLEKKCSSPCSSPTSSVQTGQKQIETTLKIKVEDSAHTFESPPPPIPQSSSTTSVKNLSPISPTLVQSHTVPGVADDESPEAKRRRISLPSTSTSTFPINPNNMDTESDIPQKNYAINSMSLRLIVGNIDEKTVSQWQVSRLAEFIGTIPGCQLIANTFKEQLIDGESFLMLSQNDFIKVMGLKLGPAIKLSNVIRMINDNNVAATYKSS